MKIEQIIYKEQKFNKKIELSENAQLVLLFGSRNLIEDKEIFLTIKEKYKNAYIMGSSTAGNVENLQISDEQINITAIYFEKSRIICGSVDLEDFEDDMKASIKMINSIEKENLKSIFLLTEGLNINAGRFVEGLKNSLDVSVKVVGGLAGDGADFKKTSIIANDYAKSNCVVYVAFYDNINVGCCAYGGWTTFGIERIVTKSKGKKIYTIDGQPAVNLYKAYLGEDNINKLSANLDILRFPMAFRKNETDEYFIRTVLGIDEKTGALEFKADIPESSTCKLMKANKEKLIEGAAIATQNSYACMNNKVDLALIISCFGRRYILHNRIDEELDAIKSVMENDIPISGFYSYGEIGPQKENTYSEMHNQTLTVMLLSED